MTNAPGYLYVIHVREFLRNKEPVYKVGRTDNIARRLSQYPKGSKLIAVVAVRNMSAAETDLLHRLCMVCKVRIDLGREYVQGALDTVMQSFWTTVTEDAYRWPSGGAEEATLPEDESKALPEDESKALPEDDSKALKVDPDVCVVNFVQARKAQLSNQTVASLRLYQEFQTEAELKGCYLSHNRFTNTLKKHFDVVAKPLRLPEVGLCQVLIFEDLNATVEELIKRIFDLQKQAAEARDEHTMKDISMKISKLAKKILGRGR